MSCLVAEFLPYVLLFVFLALVAWLVIMIVEGGET